MRILHTSDWHLGKVFHEYCLVEDQRFVLNQIIEEIKKAQEEKNPYSALVISGDIYDRAVPMADAVKLLNWFMVQVNDVQKDLHVFMISGNHDGASRLSFAAEFLELHNIHLVTDTSKITQAVVVTHGEEKTAFYQLPFLVPLSIKNENEDFLRSQQELYDEGCSQILEAHRKNYGDMPCVLNAHLFTSGCETEASERSNIGTAEQVNVSSFKGFTYGAFGHIHRCQPCDREKRCWYSGALLAYNFDDSPETGMLDVEISTAEKVPEVKRIPFKPLHPVVKLEGKIADFTGSLADKKLLKENKNNFVQVILTDEVLPQNPMVLLKQNLPYLLLITAKAKENFKGSQSIKEREEAIRSNDPEKIIEKFLEDAYGEPYSVLGQDPLVASEKKLFMEEAQSTEDQ